MLTKNDIFHLARRNRQVQMCKNLNKIKKKLKWILIKTEKRYYFFLLWQNHVLFVRCKFITHRHTWDKSFDVKKVQVVYLWALETILIILKLCSNKSHLLKWSWSHVSINDGVGSHQFLLRTHTYALIVSVIVSRVSVFNSERINGSCLYFSCDVIFP